MESDAARTTTPHDRPDVRARSRTPRAQHLGTRARARPSCVEPDVVQLVLVDQTIVPTVGEITDWVGVIADPTDGSRPRSIRTGALFPGATEQFSNAGFRIVDELVLLERDLTTWDRSRPPAGDAPGVRLRRLRARDHGAASIVDRRAFGDPWGYSATDLADVRSATPLHRARAIKSDGQVVAFAISGAAAGNGYLQRLAVDPDDQRRGFATALVADSLVWMGRHRSRRATVNTGVDNRPALTLYESFGFEVQPERLHVMQLELSPRRSISADA